MSRVHDTITRTRIGQIVGCRTSRFLTHYPLQIVSPLQSADQTNIIRPRVADDCQQALKPWCISGRGPCRTTVSPGGPESSVISSRVIGFVVKVEHHCGIILDSGRTGHCSPKCFGIHVRHGLLGRRGSPTIPTAAGGGANSTARGPGPMKVQVQVDIVVLAIIRHRQDHSLVCRLVFA